MRENGVTPGHRDASVTVLVADTAALIRVAAGLADADQQVLVAFMSAALKAGARPEWLEEAVLAGVLFVGFPRALVGAAALRSLIPEPAGDPGDACDYGAWRNWRERGVATCAAVYGANYDRLRANVGALHPALDAWIITDGYGRTLSRPGLDLRRRELCAIAMLVPQRVSSQLHSHLRGALNAGATPEEVDAVLDIVAALAVVPGSRTTAARRLWAELKSRP